jgi:hypothetical protein
MDKYEELLQYSDPIVVRKKVDQYLGKDVQLYISTRPTKKYMIQNLDGNFIHFGEMGYADYTRTLNDTKRRSFRSRNAKWSEAPKWTPAWLSYYLLW